MISTQSIELTNQKLQDSFKLAFQASFPTTQYRTVVGWLVQKVSATENSHLKFLTSESHSESFQERNFRKITYVLSA